MLTSVVFYYRKTAPCSTFIHYMYPYPKIFFQCGPNPLLYKLNAEQFSLVLHLGLKLFNNGNIK